MNNTYLCIDRFNCENNTLYSFLQYCTTLRYLYKFHSSIFNFCSCSRQSKSLLKLFRSLAVQYWLLYKLVAYEKILKQIVLLQENLATKFTGKHLCQTVACQGLK